MPWQNDGFLLEENKIGSVEVRSRPLIQLPRKSHLEKSKQSYYKDWLYAWSGRQLNGVGRSTPKLLD